MDELKPLFTAPLEGEAVPLRKLVFDGIEAMSDPQTARFDDAREAELEALLLDQSNDKAAQWRIAARELSLNWARYTNVADPESGRPNGKSTTVGSSVTSFDRRASRTTPMTSN